jgi:flagellar basal-body rod protein FlgF
MSIYADIALSQQLALMRSLHSISHNIANFKTPGFQAKSLVMTEVHSPVTGSDVTGTGNYSFVEDVATIRDLSQGRFVETGNPLHVYIKGRAYFAVQTPDAIRYTRSGVFTLNDQNELVTPEGYQVLSNGNAPIIFPEGVTDIMIAADGTISSPQGQIAQLGLFHFSNEQLLKDIGDNLLSSPENPVIAEEYALTQFGFEGSNVNEVVETTRLIDVMRQFQYIQKFLEQESQSHSQATRSLLKISTYA